MAQKPGMPEHKQHTGIHSTVRWRSVLCWALCVFATQSLAFNTIGSGFGSKWDDPQFGTGAVVTWSFMSPGVPLSSNPALATWSGTNSLGTGSADDIRTKIDAAHGAGAFDAAVRRALATWSAAAHVQFVEVADSGAAMAGSTTPDIRIGAFHFAVGDFAGGAGFGPPGDDLNFPDALAGDLALNDRNRFVVATGAEGTPLPTDNGVYLNDVEGLVLHEIGHTLGLAHSTVTTSVMCGYVSPAFDGSACDYQHVNHELDPDDIAGIQSIYGATVAASNQQVPLPAWALAVLAGLLGGLIFAHGSRRSMLR